MHTYRSLRPRQTLISLPNPLTKMMKNILLLVMAALPAAGRIHGITTRSRSLVGGDYCTLEPNKTCYASGSPSCCSEDNPTTACPEDPPPCEITEPTTTTVPTVFPEQEYCKYGADPSCYIDGWPSCCNVSDEGPCPITQPPCDVTTTSTTTTFTTTTTTTAAPELPGETTTTPDPLQSVPTAAFGPPYCNSASDSDCYAGGLPACCQDPMSCLSTISPACDDDVVSTSTSSTSNPGELPVTPFPPLTLPEGGLNGCNQVIPSDYENDIIPKEVILAFLGDSAAAMQGLVTYDARAHKVCTTCEEMNKLWEANDACEADGPCTSKASASEVMPYCVEGSFAYGRTMSGLLLEPIDPTTKEPLVGKVAATVYNFPTDTNPFLAPSQWPSNFATNPTMHVAGLFTASAGTYTLIPDVLGNGEDWEGVRSYIVKTIYQASAVPLLLKVKDDIENKYSCTKLDKRVAIMGYSEGGYATIAIAHAIDMLDDDYVHTYTGVGGAPIKLASEQMYAIGKKTNDVHYVQLLMFSAMDESLSHNKHSFLHDCQSKCMKGYTHYPSSQHDWATPTAPPMATLPIRT